MIVHAPNAKDFLAAGSDFLNLGWSMTVDLLWAARDVGLGYSDPQYVERSQRTLATSLALAQQGGELILKSEICKVSPYLLLSDPAAKWGNAAFSERRTIDAVDLIPMYSNVVRPLPDDFRTKFEDMRTLRNRMFHGTGASEQLSAQDVIKWVLLLCAELCPWTTWVTLRREFIQRSPAHHIHDNYGNAEHTIELDIGAELLCAAETLGRSDALKLLGIHKKNRFYVCPLCRWGDLDEQQKIAQLRIPTQSSTALWCPACERELAVTRHDCPLDECEGNVLYNDEGIPLCLTCDQWLDDVLAIDETGNMVRLQD